MTPYQYSVLENIGADETDEGQIAFRMLRAGIELNPFALFSALMSLDKDGMVTMLPSGSIFLSNAGAALLKNPSA